MARARRVDLPGLIYHVINRGNNRREVFYDENDYEHYLCLLHRYKQKFAFKLFAYCLMPNHVHLLLQRTEKGSLGQIMQAVTNAHTSRFQFRYQTSGHVWQGRYKNPIVSDDSYLLTVMRYVEQNPIRAGLVSDMKTYKWSSYQINISLTASGLVDRNDNPMFECLGNNKAQRIEEYKRLIGVSLGKSKLEAIRKSSENGLGFMSEEYQQKITLLMKKPKRGRPVKKING